MGIDDQFYAKNILLDNGYTSELYCAEYYIIRSETSEKLKKIILKNQKNLFLTQVDLNTNTKTLIEELEEQHTKEISNRGCFTFNPRRGPFESENYTFLIYLG